MTLKDQIGTDFAATALNVNEFATAVTYTPTGGAGTSINALISRDEPFQEPYVRGDNFAICQIAVAVTDVSNPQHGDKYTFDGSDWQHDPSQEVITDTPYFFIISLRRIE